MSVSKTTLAPRQLLHSVHMEESCLAWKVTQCCTTKPNLEVLSCPGQQKTHGNSNRRQTVDRDKVNLGVTDLPRVKQLPLVHIKRPLGYNKTFFTHRKGQSPLLINVLTL